MLVFTPSCAYHAKQLALVKPSWSFSLLQRTFASKPSSSSSSLIPSYMTVLPMHPESHIRQLHLEILPTDTKETWISIMDWHHVTWLKFHEAYHQALPTSRKLTDQEYTHFANAFLGAQQHAHRVYYQTWLKKLVHLIYLDMRQCWSRVWQR